jgi:hypothetical protein
VKRGSARHSDSVSQPNAANETTPASTPPNPPTYSRGQTSIPIATCAEYTAAQGNIHERMRRKP